MAVALERGKRVEEWTVVRIIGEGGEGRCYLVRNGKGEEAVLKECGYPIYTPLGREDWKRTQRLRRLIGFRHPNVARLYRVFLHDEMPYVVMEYVSDEPLDKRLRRGGLGTSEIIELFDGLLAGLEGLHGQNVIHRDIKPENIMLAKGTGGSSVPKYVDFGIVLHPEMSRLTVKMKPLGTPAYMAPEQFNGEGKIDERTDLYALGVTLFEVLAGRLPCTSIDFAELAKAAFSERRPSIRDYRPDWGVPLDDYVKRLMALHPSDRFPSAAAARTAWRSLAEDHRVWAGSSSGPGAVPRKPMPSGLHRKAPSHSWDKGSLIYTGSEHVIEPLTVSDRSPTGTSLDLFPYTTERRSHKGFRYTVVVKRPRLVIVGGERTGKLAIGRDGNHLGRFELNPADDAISRIHIHVTSTEHGFLITDLGSQNGLIYRDRRRRRVRIRPGDELVVGNTTLRCE